MTNEKYINNLEQIINLAKTNNKKAKFVFISPWLSNSNDEICKLKVTEKLQLFSQYANSLNIFCDKNNYLYINPNPYIYDNIKQNYSKFMIDYIHPNNKDGIELFSEAILYSSP